MTWWQWLLTALTAWLFYLWGFKDCERKTAYLLRESADQIGELSDRIEGCRKDVVRVCDKWESFSKEVISKLTESQQSQ